MPVTRRSQSTALSKSNTTDSETKSSTSSSIIVDDVTDSDFQPLPKFDRAMSVMTRRSRAVKRTITEIDSSDAESIKEESTSTTQSLALPTGRRKKGKEKATDALTISSSGPIEPEYTPATSVSDDFGAVKVDSEEDADQAEDIVLIDDDESDEPFEIESGSETNDVSSSDEESSTPLWSRTSRQGGRRRIPTRSARLDSEELQALDSDTSIEGSDAPLRGRTRSEAPAPAANARTRNRRNRQQRPPRKSWVSLHLSMPFDKKKIKKKKLTSLLQNLVRQSE